MKRSMAVGLLSAVLVSSYAVAPQGASAASAPLQRTLQTQVQAGVNLRDLPSVSSGKVIRLLERGSTITILEKTNPYFYKVETSAGEVGYVSSSDKYIQLQDQGLEEDGEDLGSEQEYVDPSSSLDGLNNSVPPTLLGSNEDTLFDASATSSRTKKIDKVIQVGKKYLGTPYEFGSNRNTTTTFDCSDFVRQAYREALNIVLPADSRGQGAWVKSNSKAVYSINNLKKGDLLFFMSYKGSSASAYKGINKNTERITHVAMYIGNGQIMHTYSKKSGGVRIDKLDGSWVYRFLYGGSVLK